MSRAPRLLLIASLALSAAACGRGQLDPGGFSFGGRADGALDPQDASAPRDATPPRDSSVPSRPDVSVGQDSGPITSRDAEPRDTGIRDGGAPFECQAPADCFATFGVPRCPNGAGRWQCLEGFCNPDCPVVGCSTDCDCPFDQSCTINGCAATGRINTCCANPMCVEGQVCVNPDGSRDRCEGSADAGVPDTGRPRRDAGVPPGRDSGVPPLPDGGLVGPDGSVTPDSGIAACTSDCDCDPSLACLGGQCFPAGRPNLCCTNPMCAPGSMCLEPDGSPGVCGSTTPVGAACDPMGPQCGPSGFCIDEGSGFPDGYCTQGCGRNNPCPSGATCRGNGGNAFCLDECTAPADCRAGYNCIQLGVGMGSRVCWPTPPTSTNPMGAPVGSSCSDDQDCVSGTSCLQEQGFPGGYCTTLYCDPVTSPCPGGSACYAFPGLFSMCLAECPSGGMRSTCRPQYYCLGPTGQAGVCIGN